MIKISVIPYNMIFKYFFGVPNLAAFITVYSKNC
jgi:hypothetical protein